MEHLEHAWNGLESFERTIHPETLDMPPVVVQWLTLRSMRTNPLVSEPYGPPLPMREHTCTLYQCKKYIETIYEAPPEPPNRPPRHFSIYGCMFSGHVHLCRRDDQCIPYTDQVGMYYCVFSKDSIGITFDPWTRGDPNYAGTHSTDFNRDHIPMVPVEPGEDSIASSSSKDVSCGPLAENLWKGRRSKQGVHRIVNSSNPKYRRPYRTKDSLPEKVSVVLCADVRTGASFLTLCRNMEYEALQIFQFVLGDSELRREHSSRQRKIRIGEAAARIKLYVETSETTNLAPNMHVLDNIYDSITARDGTGECITDPEVIGRLPILASSGLVMWLTYMISIGGYPFRPSERGKDAAKVIFSSDKGMKRVFDRVTDAVNPTSYFTCYRRFMIGLILSLGRSDIILRYHDPPSSANCVRTDTLLSHEPTIFLSLTSQDVIESLSTCAANMSLATSSTTRKRKATYCVDRLVNDLGLINNGTLLAKKSVKDSESIFENFLDAVTLTELQLPMSEAIHVCKRSRSEGICRREETHVPERPTSKTISLDDVANPYLCLVTAYGDMHRL